MNREMREYEFTSNLRNKIDERDEKIIKCMTIIGTLERENGALEARILELEMLNKSHAAQIVRNEIKISDLASENARLVDDQLSTRSRLQKVINAIGRGQQ